MEDVIAAMSKKDSLHPDQGGNPFELKRQASDLHVKEMKTKFENRNLANIRIDDSMLEKNLAMILDRLSAVEFVQESMGSDSLPASPDLRPGSSSSGRYQGVDPVQKLIQQLSDRLGKIESMVESSSGDAPPDADGTNSSGASRPTTKDGDRKISITNSAFAAAQAESSKDKPDMPVITRTIFKELTGLTARVKRFEDAIAGQKAFQDAKDKAQDEMLAMEMGRINDDIKGRVSNDDLDKLERKFKNEMRALRTELEERQDKQGLKIANEVGAGVRTLRDQVKVINDATKGITDNLDSRLKRLEKDVREELDEMEQKTREIVEEAVERATSELRQSTEAQLHESKRQLEEASKTIAQVASQQEALAQETGGEAEKIENEMHHVTDTLSHLLEGGGLAEMIKEGASKDIQDLGLKMSDELSREASRLKAGTDATRQAVSDLEAKLSQGTEELRKYVVEGVEVRTSAVEKNLDELAQATQQQLGAQSQALDKVASGLEHTCVGLQESLAQAHASIADAGAKLEEEGAKVDRLEAAIDVRVGGAETRLDNLEEVRDANALKVESLDGRLGSVEVEAHKLGDGLKRAMEGVNDAGRSAARCSDEARAHRRALDGALQTVNEELGGRLDEDRKALVGLEASTAAQRADSKELRDSFGALVTKESFWDVMSARSKWHAERLGKHCNDTEAACTASSAPRLSPEATAYLSGHAQRIAKVVAAQADAAVVKDVVSTAGGVTNESVASLAMAWDAKVDEMRAQIAESFVASVEKCAKRGRPRGLGEDGHVIEARKAFLKTLTLALQLSLSKFARILPAETLLGARGLAAQHGACAACARPFGASAASLPGDRRSMAPEGSEEGGPLADHSRSESNHGGHRKQLGSLEQASDDGSVGSSSSRSARASPFKQAKRIPKRIPPGPSPSGNPPGSGGINLGAIGEWDDAASVSSLASNASRHSLDAGPLGGGVSFPAV